MVEEASTRLLSAKLGFVEGFAGFLSFNGLFVSLAFLPVLYRPVSAGKGAINLSTPFCLCMEATHRTCSEITLSSPHPPCRKWHCGSQGRTQWYVYKDYCDVANCFL
jgi:hypothetical protein